MVDRCAELLEGLATITKAGIEAGIHAAAGAASGAINSAIAGGDIGQGALVAGLSAGAAEFVGAYALPKAPFYNDLGRLGQEAAQLGSRAALGSLAGGVTAELTGGDFGEGAITGAWTAAYGYAFNRMMHETLVDRGWTEEQISQLDEVSNNFRFSIDDPVKFLLRGVEVLKGAGLILGGVGLEFWSATWHPIFGPVAATPAAIGWITAGALQVNYGAEHMRECTRWGNTEADSR